jgi:hypothetical protein
MCQRCHLAYDAAHQALNAARTRVLVRRGQSSVVLPWSWYPEDPCGLGQKVGPACRDAS